MPRQGGPEQDGLDDPVVVGDERECPRDVEVVAGGARVPVQPPFAVECPQMDVPIPQPSHRRDRPFDRDAIRSPGVDDRRNDAPILHVRLPSTVAVEAVEGEPGDRDLGVDPAVRGPRDVRTRGHDDVGIDAADLGARGEGRRPRARVLRDAVESVLPPAARALRQRRWQPVVVVEIGTASRIEVKAEEPASHPQPEVERDGRADPFGDDARIPSSRM